MAKSNYLSGVLLPCIVCFHFCIAGNIVGKENQESRARNQDQGPFSAGLSSRSMSGFRPPNSDTRLQKLVKRIYDSQIGVRESGINKGLQVEKYLKYVNLAKGNPWCAAFVCWVFGQAGVSSPQTGWSPSLFPASKVIWNRESGTKSQESRFPANVPVVFGSSPATRNPPTGQARSQLKTPETGDIFGIYFPEKGRIAHTGFIDEWDGTWLVTVEGNTNESGSREGDGVYRKRRTVRSIYKAARYIN